MNASEVPAPPDDANKPAGGRPIPDVALAKHINHTPFPSQYYQSINQHGEVFHVVATRITYDLRNTWGQNYLRYAARQTALERSDVWDGVPNESSPLWESDFAPYKPKCDVLAVNAVSRPDQGVWGKLSGTRPAARRWSCGIALQWLGEDKQPRIWHKQFVVTGERTHSALIGVSEPKATHEVRIHWQNAFGGQIKEPVEDRLDRAGRIIQSAGSKRWLIDERNPVGHGLNQSHGSRAPQLEPSVSQPYHGQKKYPPVCLTALGKAWLPRRLLAGTYDKQWRDQQWPLPPMDFDFAYWNCAPADQQIDYPAPGTQLDLFALYPPDPVLSWPDHFTANLPPHQLFIYAYVLFAVDKRSDILANLDTLVINMATLQLYATYRVVVPASELPSGSAPLVLETRMAPSGQMCESVPSSELGPLG